MGKFNFSGLSDIEVDDILELKAELEADALWLEEQIKKDGILKNRAAGQAPEEKEENQ
ncbi:MAG: hypothetical protein ACKN9V_06900 [Pseudomonadota bacterium]